jgi:hypothetical protein
VRATTLTESSVELARCGGGRSAVLAGRAWGDVDSSWRHLDLCDRVCRIKVRRQVWQSARKLRDQSIAKKFKGARWALLRNPLDLTEDQSGTLREIKRSGGAPWRAYQLKESLRAVLLSTRSAYCHAYSYPNRTHTAHENKVTNRTILSLLKNC